MKLDEWNYPVGPWPNKETQLLFDLGYSYSLLSNCEETLSAFHSSLIVIPSKEAAGLRNMLADLLGQLVNFREHRMSVRDDLYEAGHLAAVKLEKKEKQ